MVTNSGTIKFNGEQFAADTIEYEGLMDIGYVGDMYIENEQLLEEEEDEDDERVVHWVVVKTPFWFSDCGDVLCAASRELVVRSDKFDVLGNFSLEGVAKEKGGSSFEYLFRSFGEVEFTIKGA